MADDTAETPSHAVQREINRIKSAQTPRPAGDTEDLISYAKDVTRMRAFIRQTKIALVEFH